MLVYGGALGGARGPDFASFNAVRSKTGWHGRSTGELNL